VRELATQSGVVDEVDERPLAVDLDDGQPFAVPGLELRFAADVDLIQREPELVARGANGRERALTEMAARRVVDGDLRYG